LYRAFSSACLAVGATPILVTHFRITRRDEAYDVPEIDDLSFAGIQEWARQWFLLSRREKYVPGSGQHRLWLSAGGSAGQSGLWSLDIDEGVINEEFGGRFWDVRVSTATEQRTTEKHLADEKRKAKLIQQGADDERAVMKAVNDLADESGIAGYTKVRDLSGVPKSGRFERAVSRLTAQNLIEEAVYAFATGKGGKVKGTGRGLRRPAETVSDDCRDDETTVRPPDSLDGQSDSDCTVGPENPF